MLLWRYINIIFWYYYFGGDVLKTPVPRQAVYSYLMKTPNFEGKRICWRYVILTKLICSAHWQHSKIGCHKVVGFLMVTFSTYHAKR